MRRLLIVTVTTLLAFGVTAMPAGASASTIEDSRSAELAYYGVTAVGLLESPNPEAILAADIDAAALTGSPTTGVYTATTANGVAAMAGIELSALVSALNTTIAAMPGSAVAWTAPLANGDELAIFDPGFWEGGQTIVGWFVPAPKQEPPPEPEHHEPPAEPKTPTTHEETPPAKTTTTPEPTPTTTATTPAATTPVNSPAATVTTTHATTPRFRVLARRAQGKFILWTVYAPSAGELLVHHHVIRHVHHAGIVTVRVKRGTTVVWRSDRHP
jgi:hypothetical protein